MVHKDEIGPKTTTEPTTTKKAAESPMKIHGKKSMDVLFLSDLSMLDLFTEETNSLGSDLKISFLQGECTSSGRSSTNSFPQLTDLTWKNHQGSKHPYFSHHAGNMSIGDESEDLYSQRRDIIARTCPRVAQFRETVNF